MRIEWVSVSQIKILAGSRCRSADNTADIVFSSDYTIDMTNATPTTTTGGRTVAEASSTAYYAYVGLDVNGLPLAWLDTADLSVGGSVTYPAAYSRGVRQLLVNCIQDEQLIVFNDSVSDIDYIGGSIIWLTGGNGHGSTNNKIRRLLTIVRNIGNAGTLTQSATLGDSITINKNGNYKFEYVDGYSAGAARLGLSWNTTEPTITITTINNLTRLIQERSTAPADFKSTGISLDLKKGDVVRPHTDGLNDLTVDSAVLLRMTRSR